MDYVYIHDGAQAYPDRDFVHMVQSKKVHDYVYDDDFPYRLKGPKTRFVRFFIHLLMIILVQPVAVIRYGLKIKGKENIKKYKAIAPTKAMITVCNHTTEWDILFINTARYCTFPEFPMWQEGAEGSSGMLYRYFGGIVTPSVSLKGIRNSYDAMREVIDEGKWLHIFPEAACWSFFPAIRNFKTGMFKLAYETHMPLLPMVVTYRAPKGLYKLFKKHPNATLHIGEPIQINYELDETEACRDLAKRTHEAMVHLAGIPDEETNKKIIDSLPKYHVDRKTIF